MRLAPGILLACLGTVVAGAAAAPEVDVAGPRGLEIMQRADAIPRARDYQARATWSLLPAAGAARLRETRVFFREEEDAPNRDYASKWLILVDSPRLVQGTGLLVWNAAAEGESNESWLYLPSFRKVRRIAGRKREEPFLGSDFSFADLSDRRAEEDRNRLLREEQRDGVLCDVVESIPIGDDPYGRRIHWIDRETSTVARVEFFDRDNRQVKTLDLDWIRIDGSWSWKRLEMLTLETGHRTLIELSDIAVNRGLAESLFTPTSLRLGAH